MLVTPDLAVSPCQLSVLGLAVGNRCRPGPQLLQLLYTHHKQDTLSLFGPTALKGQNHIPTGLTGVCTQGSGVSTQATRAHPTHAQPWRADVTAVSVTGRGVRGLPHALSAARAESEGPVLPLPALGQMPPPAGPCVPHGSSVPDQVRGDRQGVAAPECV